MQFPVCTSNNYCVTTCVQFVDLPNYYINFAVVNPRRMHWRVIKLGLPFFLSVTIIAAAYLIASPIDVRYNRVLYNVLKVLTSGFCSKHFILQLWHHLFITGASLYLYLHELLRVLECSGWSKEFHMGFHCNPHCWRMYAILICTYNNVIQQLWTLKKPPLPCS